MAEQRGMRAYWMTLEANVERALNVTGDYFHILEAPNPVSLSFNDDKYLPLARGIGGSFAYESIRFLSSTAQTVIIVLGFGTFADYRANVNATISTTLEASNVNAALPEVFIPAGASAKIANANGARVELRVSLKSVELGGVYLGESGVADHQGGWIEPGSVDYIATSAELWAYNPNAAAVTVSALELERA